MMRENMKQRKRLREKRLQSGKDPSPFALKLRFKCVCLPSLGAFDTDRKRLDLHSWGGWRLFMGCALGAWLAQITESE
jgi:hypothetical protein